MPSYAFLNSYRVLSMPSTSYGVHASSVVLCVVHRSRPISLPGHKQHSPERVIGGSWDLQRFLHRGGTPLIII